MLNTLNQTNTYQVGWTLYLDVKERDTIGHSLKSRSLGWWRSKTPVTGWRGHEIGGRWRHAERIGGDGALGVDVRLVGGGEISDQKGPQQGNSPGMTTMDMVAKSLSKELEVRKNYTKSEENPRIMVSAGLIR